MHDKEKDKKVLEGWAKIFKVANFFDSIAKSRI